MCLHVVRSIPNGLRHAPSNAAASDRTAATESVFAPAGAVSAPAISERPSAAAEAGRRVEIGGLVGVVRPSVGGSLRWSSTI